MFLLNFAPEKYDLFMIHCNTMPSIQKKTSFDLVPVKITQKIKKKDLPT